MMKTNWLVCLAVALPALAQNTVKDSIVKHWKTTKEFTLAVADAMPADGYGFRPSPEEMNFGQLMVHIGVADLNACALASGLDKPALPPKVAAWLKDTKQDMDKEPATAFLAQTFDFCVKAAESLTPERMETVVGPANRHMTAFEWMWSYFTHTAHHRAQAEVYLRVKGIKPPDYKF